MKNIEIALVNIRSLQNIGAIFRTASFFGFKTVLLVGYSGKDENTRGQKILHEKILKASLGSEEDIEIVLLESEHALVERAKQNQLKVFCVEQSPTSIKLQNWTPQSDSILVFGNEVDGISPFLLKQAYEIIEIERTGKHNSLNVATTAGIVLNKVRDYSVGALVNK